MKTAEYCAQAPEGFPGAAEMATLRAWYAGLPARQAVQQYLGDRKATGQSSRAMISAIRLRLERFAVSRHRQEVVDLLRHPAGERLARAKRVLSAVEALRAAPLPAPLISDDVRLWLPTRIAAALHRAGLDTLANLTLRVPRLRRWWVDIPGLGATGAKAVEHLFGQHPELSARAAALAELPAADTVPWERLVVPADLDGSRGTFRAPSATCALSATNDYQAVQAWLSLQESAATLRAYRKEAERLMLWAILERGKALTSLTTEDAIAYRQFLRRPSPRERWVGPSRPRLSAQWRPFQGPLSARSASYALSVIAALFRWLMEQRYTVANPFSGVKVKSGGRAAALDAARGFTEAEWQLVRTAAQDIEWTGGWSRSAAARLHLLLDFCYATGLRRQEVCNARLGALHRDEHGDDWLTVTGKGSKVGDVAVPLAAMAALERYLAARGLPVSRGRWLPSTPLIPSEMDPRQGITASRLWAIVRRFFDQAAQQLQEHSPALSHKLRRATPHWMRHTHATHALAHGADLTAVRDNLRHASIATTSVYLHGDKAKRARQMREAFPIAKGGR